jgi:lipoteichoic acid synthase
VGRAERPAAAVDLGAHRRGRGLSRWRVLVPDRWAWPRLVASPSSYLLLLAFAVTAAAKLRVLRDIDGVSSVPLWWIAAAAPDAAFCAGLAALFARGERRVPRILAITLPLSLVVAAVSVINAAYLGITGEQITWQTLSLGLDRWGDVHGIVGEEATRLGWRVAVAGAVLVGVPLLALWALRRAGQSIHPTAVPGRAHASLLCAGLALVVALTSPASRVFAVDQLAANAVLRTYWGWLTQEPVDRSADVWFDGYRPSELVSPAAMTALRRPTSPNVVLIVMESTGREATGLAGSGAPARTPNLEALAAHGLEVASARAAVPHTTKSLFTILCGRLPLMQLALIETTGSLDIQCLPAVLRGAGWRTGFFQSSLGVFEDRARLVHLFGFESFAAWEDIGGEPLGYLASDDLSLAGALSSWLDRARDPLQPFFVTLLTSATHHPYRLSAAAEARARASGAPAVSARDRHARLVEEEDRLLGSVLDLLRQRGLDRTTVVVALGDHGEGFGEKGIRQHDNNFFDEGLRVPWVMAGPGVPHARVDEPTSLIDVTPTILQLLGATVAPETARAIPGRPLLHGAPRSRMLVFSCWYDERCRGFVQDGRKVVYVPEEDRAFWFDLAADPHENVPRTLDADLAARLRAAHRVVDSHRTPDWPMARVPVTDYAPWLCPADEPCHHPRSPKSGLFRAP